MADKRSVVVWGSWAAIMAILLGTAGFAAEGRALAWHARNGMYVEGAGLRVRVPLLWNVIAGADAINLIDLDGFVRTRLHSPTGLILISNKASQKNAGTLPTIRQHMQDLGAKEIAHRDLQAGRSKLTCAEFQGFREGSLVWCVGEDTNLIAEFNGATELVPVFYSVLESAQAR